MLGRLGLCLLSMISLAAKPPPDKAGKKSVLDVQFILPYADWQSDWGRNAELSFATNLVHASPFSDKDDVIVNERWSSSRYPYFSVIKIVRKRPVANFATLPSAPELKKMDLVLVATEDKNRGTPGKVYRFRQYLDQRVWMEKWVAVFGNDDQSCFLVVYIDSNHARQARSQIRRTVHEARFADNVKQKYSPLSGGSDGPAAE